MSILERAPRDREITTPEKISTGFVHRFKSRAEFLQVKGMELLQTGKNLLAEAFNKNKLVIEEGCFNRLCGAPLSAHYFSPS